MTRRPRPQAADLRRFAAQLTTPARLSAIRALLDGAFVAWTLRHHGARRLLRDVAVAGHRDPARAVEICAAVDAGLSMLPMAPTCLRRSVTLLRELDRRGLHGTMHIGVGRPGSRIEAHAWVQVGDVVINDAPDIAHRYPELAGDSSAIAGQLR